MNRPQLRSLLSKDELIETVSTSLRLYRNTGRCDNGARLRMELRRPTIPSDSIVSEPDAVFTVCRLCR